jgi:hypothetical protein
MGVAPLGIGLVYPNPQVCQYAMHVLALLGRLGDFVHMMMMPLMFCGVMLSDLLMVRAIRIIAGDDISKHGLSEVLDAAEFWGALLLIVTLAAHFIHSCYYMITQYFQKH